MAWSETTVSQDENRALKRFDQPSFGLRCDERIINPLQVQDPNAARSKFRSHCGKQKKAL